VGVVAVVASNVFHCVNHPFQAQKTWRRVLHGILAFFISSFAYFLFLLIDTSTSVKTAATFWFAPFEFLQGHYELAASDVLFTPHYSASYCLHLVFLAVAHLRISIMVLCASCKVHFW